MSIPHLHQTLQPPDLSGSRHDSPPVAPEVIVNSLVTHPDPECLQIPNDEL